jgi:hypothetical protein
MGIPSHTAGSRSARKRSSQSARKTVTDSRLDASSPSEESDINEDELLEKSFRALTIETKPVQSSVQLPFLRRNIRKALDHVDHSSESSAYASFPKIRKIFIVDGKRLDGFYSFGWRCPLCQIKMQFGSRGGLEKHLELDHESFLCTWSTENEVSGVGVIRRNTLICSVVSMKSLLPSSFRMNWKNRPAGT